MLVLITGATGKVGRRFVEQCLAGQGDSLPLVCARFATIACWSRTTGSRSFAATSPMSADVERAMQGVTHVLHLATCKETPDEVMDVTVKGLFWLLEAFRE